MCLKPAPGGERDIESKFVDARDRLEKRRVNSTLGVGREEGRRCSQFLESWQWKNHTRTDLKKMLEDHIRWTMG